MMYLLAVLIAVVMFTVMGVLWRREVNRLLKRYRDAVLSDAARALQEAAIQEFLTNGPDSRFGAGLWSAGSAIHPEDGNLMGHKP